MALRERWFKHKDNKWYPEMISYSPSLESLIDIIEEIFRVFIRFFMGVITIIVCSFIFVLIASIVLSILGSRFVFPNSFPDFVFLTYMGILLGLTLVAIFAIGKIIIKKD
jgi:hypothetical protein